MNDANDILGKSLGEVDPEALSEWNDLLEHGALCGYNRQVNARERALLFERLTQAKIESRCSCGGCRTYNFVYPADYEEHSHSTVRFYVDGEALLHLVNDCIVVGVSRIFEDVEQDAARYVCAPE